MNQNATSVVSANTVTMTMTMTDNTMDVDVQTEYYAGWSDEETRPIRIRSRTNSESSILSSISFTNHSSSVTENINVVSPGPGPGSTSTSLECCICYETIDSYRNNCITPCGHSFCFICIAKSMQVRNTCPCCRQPFYEVSSSMPMVIEEEEEEGEVEIAVNDWFIEASTTTYTGYDEWPPNSHAMRHSLDPLDELDNDYEVLNQNFSNLIINENQGEEEEEEPDISSTVFPELSMSTPPPSQRRHMDHMNVLLPPHIIGHKRRRPFYEN
jgi:hypothetical protein